MPESTTTKPTLTPTERTERLERAIGQIGLWLNRSAGSRVWRAAPDLLSLTEQLTGEVFDPMAPTRG